MNEMNRLVDNSTTPIIILIKTTRESFACSLTRCEMMVSLLSQFVVVSSKAILHISLINLKFCLDSYSFQAVMQTFNFVSGSHN